MTPSTIAFESIIHTKEKYTDCGSQTCYPKITTPRSNQLSFAAAYPAAERRIAKLKTISANTLKVT